MRYFAIIIILLSLTSCGETDKYPDYYRGDAEVQISDGFQSDTLNSCSCWRNKDSLGISIQNLNFGGILVKISEKNGLVKPSIIYYSDYGEFDGEFELQTEIKSEQINLKIWNSNDSIHLTGDLTVEAEENKFYRQKRNIIADGSFNCSLKI